METYTARGRPPFAVRLATTERRVLEAAAAQTREAVGTYIRRVALERARRELATGEDR